MITKLVFFGEVVFKQFEGFCEHILNKDKLE